MNDKLSELRNDFNQLVEKVDLTSYNPMSADFQKILNVGLMWMLLDELAEEHEEKLDDEYSKAREELMSAESYFDMYSKEKDITLKTMTSQELNHAYYFLNKIRLMSKNNEQQNQYLRLKSWYDNLLNKINS